MNAEFINAINDLEQEKGIDAEILFSAIETALITAFKRNFDSNENVRVEMNKENGDIHVYAQREVVEVVENPELQISLKDAKEISKKNNTLLGVNTSDKLTIQIDYDEEVFLMRPMLFSDSYNANIGGYYNKK